MSRAWEKFYLAVRGLACGQGKIQDRLISAFVHHLVHLQNDELPEKLQNDFQALRQKVTTEEPVGKEGSIKITVSKMSNQEAKECIEKIVDMYNDLCRIK